MSRSLVVTDSRIWNAETEYACAVAGAELALGWHVTLAAPRGSAALGSRDVSRWRPGNGRAAGSVQLEELPGAEPGRSPADFLADVRFLSGLTSRGAYDVVHSSRSAAHVAAALGTGRRAPLVHLRGGARPPRGHAVNRFLYGRATAAVVVSSERVGRWVVDGLGVPPARVHRLFAPVDVDRFESTARAPRLLAELGVPEGAALVVNVARLAPIKGQHVLVEAMARVLEDHPRAFLLLVGEAWSGEPAGLTRRARDLGIERSVIASGRRDDVPAILKEAAVCVSSSLGSEENSRAVSEYMAAARPLVATRVGVIPELVEDGVSGLLSEPGDPVSLASGISRMLGDPDLATRAAVSARAFAHEHLSPEAFGRGIVRALESVGVSS